MILIFKFNIILKCQGFESHHLHNGGGGGFKWRKMVNNFYDELSIQIVKFHHFFDDYICLQVLVLT